MEHYQVFLSYSRNDLDQATALLGQLEKSGLSCFRDQDSIREGDNWLQKLQEAVDASGSFVLLVGRDGIRRWMAAETEVALVRHIDPHDESLRLPIFPVLLGDVEPEDLHAFLRRFQVTRWNGTNTLPDRLIEQIRNRSLIHADDVRYEGCPFVGLHAFQPNQAHLFFGRQKETLDALACFDMRIQDKPIRWLQIQGNSGSGKSSLMNAGLLPLIAQGWLFPRTGVADWQVIGPMMPGQHPLSMLAEQLARAFSTETQTIEMGDVRQRLQADNRGLSDWLRSRKQNDTAFLLAIDQFEELFTVADAAEREAFDERLAMALQDSECPLFVLSTVRADFLDQYDHKLTELQAVLARAGHSWPLPPISTKDLPEIIDGPAALARLDVSEVKAAIIAEAENEPGALPLVENALAWLWEQRQNNRLDGSLYNKSGGLAGILSINADLLLKGLESNKPLALELLFNLVRVDPEGRQHTRQRLLLDDAITIAGGGESGQALIDTLAGRRDDNGQTLQGPLRLITVADGAVNLIHETLIRTKGVNDKGKPTPYWPTLWQHIANNTRRAILRQRLGIAASEWQQRHGLSRLFGLANWSDAWRLIGMRGRNALERRYRRWSLTRAGIWASVVVAIVGLAAEAYVWKMRWDLPLEANLTRWAYRIGAELPLPTLVRIPREVVNNDQPAVAVEGKDYPVSIPFFMASTETTFAQYDLYCEATGRKKPLHQGWGRDNRPAINVDWYDASAYTRWLSAMTGADCRLPTEWEWQYAAQAETAREYGIPAEMNGSDDIRDKGLANCSGCGGEWEAKKRTAPVSSFPANAWGLHDMHGNVWEWCRNEYDNPENTGPGVGNSRALRGGSWGSGPEFARASNRIRINPDFRSYDVGFRVLCSSPISR